VERDIMVVCSVAFWRAVIAIWAIGCTSWGSLVPFPGSQANG
jgi:hypothetical protein